jgi:hypothetical protein
MMSIVELIEYLDRRKIMAISGSIPGNCTICSSRTGSEKLSAVCKMGNGK